MSDFGQFRERKMVKESIEKGDGWVMNVLVGIAGRV